MCQVVAEMHGDASAESDQHRRVQRMVGSVHGATSDVGASGVSAHPGRCMGGNHFVKMIIRAGCKGIEDADSRSLSKEE